jgi:hypothetical protein
MNVTRHFSDTRTPEGRVRFLLQSGRVRLLAEGLGWHFEQALNDLERRAQLDGAA